MKGIPEEDLRKRYEAKGIVMDQPLVRTQRIDSNQDVHSNMLYAAPYAGVYGSMMPSYYMPPGYMSGPLAIPTSMPGYLGFLF